jgi:hypothetical protein
MPKFAVLASFQVEGFHCWPAAQAPVEFLRDRHRHMFHVELERWVTHRDREVEIIQLRRGGIDLLHEHFGKPCEFGALSCEDIAAFILTRLRLSRCSVLEDGENGAVVYDVHPS